jgi:transposase
MMSTSAETTPPPTVADTMSVVRSIQQDLQRTEARLQWVEVTGLDIDEAQQKLDEKFDVIYKLLTQGSEIGSGQKLPHQFRPSASPPPQQDPPTTLYE